MGVPEKAPAPLLPLAEPAAAKKANWRKPLALLLLLPFLYLAPTYTRSVPDTTGAVFKPVTCEQAKPILPQAFNVSEIVAGKKSQIIDWLSGAVKVPTEIFDVMGEIGEDPRWDVFYDFSDYLEKAFPLVHEHLTRTRVVTHALIYEWEGSDKSLQPLLITGHQDVVPVLPATRGLWTHDPFGGEYDGELIWGRGSSDDKSGTIGVLSAIELLLQSGKFTPTRTVILAFGIDEETGGKGALHLGQWIEDKYGKDSIAMLVDEGSGVSEAWGQLYATPAVGEKGYLDVELKVETLGGHSSVPPPHTGIGLISLLIAQIEKNPHEPYLNPDSPLVTYMSCAADSAPDMPRPLQKAIRKVTDSLSVGGGAKVDRKALKTVQDWWVTGSYEDGSLPKGMGKAMVSTTQATDIINGGVKVNALPEVVTAVINHRISLASSVEALQKRLADVLSPVASKYNLALEAFGEDVELDACPMHAAAAKAGKITLSEAYNSSLNPAPVSPFTVDSAAWRLLSGTVKGVYATRPEAHLSAEEATREIQMAPTISTGNTDTKRYWNLTRNIYRFAYLIGKGFSNVHTVDEHINADVFVEQVRWFAAFIINVDESREL